MRRGRLSNPEADRLFRFALVGVGNTLVTLLAYAIMVGVGLSYLVAGPVAWSLGVLHGYTWNRIWTFDRASHRASLLGRYFAVGALGLGLNTALLALLVDLLGASKIAAELISLPIVVLTTFLLNRHWVFREQIREGAPV